MTRHTMKLHPWNECVAAGAELIDKGINIHQQFNCHYCGAKQTMDQPNKFFTTGICEECGKETDIVKDGMNYMVHASNPEAVKELMKKLGGEKP